MVDLKDIFSGKDPGFMDRLFPDADWRRLLNESSRPKRDQDWTWFWDRFAPYGMLMSEDPPDCRYGTKARAKMSDLLLKGVVMGVIASDEPAAKYKSHGRLLHYWPFLKKDVPDEFRT